MSCPFLLVFCFLAAAWQSPAQTASGQSSASPVDLYAHTLENRVYTNPALGITVTYPEGWEFVDTAILRREDDEAASEYRKSLIKQKIKPEMIQIVKSGGDPSNGIMFTVTSNLFVAEKGGSGSGAPSSQIKLKTVPGGALFTASTSAEDKAKGYFQENEFFASKNVKLLSGPEIITLNGKKLGQADVRIKQSGGKPVFARIVAAYLPNPHVGSGQYVVFQFIEDSIEQAQSDSQMLQTLQLSTPREDLFFDESAAKK